MPPISPWDLGPIHSVQALGAWLEPFMSFFTFLGREEFVLLLMPLIYWCINKPLGVDMGIMLICSHACNGMVKGLLKTPRPFWIEPAVALDSEPTFGLPSGHAMNATSVWGYLAARSWTADRSRRWPGILYGASLVLVILLISLSRLYLGVHFLGDVIWGWLLGALLVALYLRLKGSLRRRLVSFTLARHLLAATASALLVFALYGLAYVVPSGSAARFGPLHATALAETAQAAASSAGMVFGAWLGLLLEARRVHFSTSGTAGQRAARYLLGLCGVFGLWLGLKMLFPVEPLALGLCLRMLRYSLLIMWTLALWPWLAIRLRLAVSG